MKKIIGKNIAIRMDQYQVTEVYFLHLLPSQYHDDKSLISPLRVQLALKFTSLPKR